MEKYSQFRDKGRHRNRTLPPRPFAPANVLWTPIHALLFALRLLPVLSLSLSYFLLLEILPIPTIIKKCVLWLLLAVPGVWWVDLQVDGVKRGRLSDKQAAGSLPKEGDIVASSFTSPLDPLYLAGIFCPVFVRTWPGEKGVQVITLWGAICMAFSQPQLESPKGVELVQLKELSKKYPDSIICVFPESTTTNGRGILPLSPALLTAGSKTKIYPVNLRYTPGDITTPVPGGAFNWVWKLLSKPTHQMRVRIARPIYNSPSIDTPSTTKSEKASGVDMGYETNIWDSPHLRNGVHVGEEKGDMGQQVLDRVGEDLARLGRVKRVGLGVREKTEFVKIWKSRRR
ncbi:uncharacterized protein N0V89_004460 [Didymosphaeria variabile]|uniref:Phospholipid/glycerol acyltransferase domain-containing protein n=1 Tax=Didymosphaeria variabile TaxID=1932322 RepID=A0A9W9CDF9_9PLEO|nr:uncharacterized protein N0V89_004460 [Didymosphaeria variabile]KAJ4356427.1 hypothetical protein N0V89_004460 [Didymosphaeria variabile]